MGPGLEPTLSDRELVEGFVRDRSEASFRQLYRQHSGRLHALVRRLLGGHPDTDEVFQESWVRIVESLGRFAGRSSFATWSSGLALNCVREWRRQRYHLPGELGESEQELRRGSPDVALDLEQVLAALPMGYREVLVLHDVHGHTHAEIAELLSITIGTSKSQLSRARRAARELLPEDLHHER